MGWGEIVLSWALGLFLELFLYFLQSELKLLVLFFVLFNEDLVVFLFLFMLFSFFLKLLFEVFYLFFIFLQVLALRGHAGLYLSFHDSFLVLEFLDLLLFEVLELLFLFFHLFLMLDFLFFNQIAQICVLFPQFIKFFLTTVGSFDWGLLCFGGGVSFENDVELASCKVDSFDDLFFFLSWQHVELFLWLIRWEFLLFFTLLCLSFIG